MPDLREDLQQSVGSAYSLSREIAGAGMSRVFVAHERALNRRVVFKVLAPELSADLSVERFKREILFAAQLQHPHIVPVLSAGDMNGVPYYTMPFVEGESLRERLNRQHVLPLDDALHILREVASPTTSSSAPATRWSRTSASRRRSSSLVRDQSLTP